MRALAAELGVSAMTPYRWLSGKEELFALVRTDAFTRFGDRLEAALDAGGAAMTRLRRLARAYVQFALDDPDAYRIMFELSQVEAPGDAAAALAAASKRAFAFLHDTVAACCEAGDLDGDPLTLAHLLWADTHGLVSLHLAGQLRMGRTLEQLLATEHHLEGVKRRKT